MKIQPCGHYCHPANDPDMKVTVECRHDAKLHYSIDGEAVGCVGCEEMLEEGK